MHCPSCGTECKEKDSKVTGGMRSLSWQNFECPNCGDKWTIYSDYHSGVSLRRKAGF